MSGLTKPLSTLPCCIFCVPSLTCITQIAKTAVWGASGKPLGKGQGPWQQLSLLAVLFNILSLHGATSRASHGCSAGRPQRLLPRPTHVCMVLRGRNDAPRGDGDMFTRERAIKRAVPVAAQPHLHACVVNTCDCLGLSVHPAEQLAV